MKKLKDFWEKSDDDSLGIGIVKKAYHEGKTISIPSFNIEISKDDGLIFDREKFDEQENEDVSIDWDERFKRARKTFAYKKQIFLLVIDDVLYDIKERIKKIFKC